MREDNIEIFQDTERLCKTEPDLVQARIKNFFLKMILLSVIKNVLTATRKLLSPKNELMRLQAYTKVKKSPS